MAANNTTRACGVSSPQYFAGRGEGEGKRTGLVGDGIGFCRREVLGDLSLEVFLFLLDRHELFAERDNRIAC